jgi:hypothetical protein
MSANIFADAPLSYPEFHEIHDKSGKFCALIQSEQTTIYKYGCLTGKEKYSIDGWHPNGYLLDEGTMFIAFHYGINLIPLDSDAQTVMIQIWKNGSKIKTITLGQIMKSLKSLRRTASHYSWGTVKEVTTSTIRLETEEGMVTIDVNSGSIYFGQKS